jgi:hypothetical protein
MGQTHTEHTAASGLEITAALISHGAECVHTEGQHGIGKGVTVGKLGGRIASLLNIYKIKLAHCHFSFDKLIYCLLLYND